MQRAAAASLSERLYRWRARCNYSQSEAALRLKVSTRTLQEWEQGRATPAHLAISAIERVIGQSVNAGSIRRTSVRRRRRYT
jgi:DNA-binding transcriptional regulator YiaG